VIFLAEFWGWLIGDFVGCHVWWPCASLSGDFAPKSPLNRTWFGGFRVARVLGLERWFLRSLLILNDSGQFLWGRGCPGGNRTIPEVSLQFVECFGRSGDGKVRVDPQVGFLEGAV
jgi:hypothetical protein